MGCGSSRNAHHDTSSPSVSDDKPDFQTKDKPIDGHLQKIDINRASLIPNASRGIRSQKTPFINNDVYLSKFKEYTKDGMPNDTLYDSDQEDALQIMRPDDRQMNFHPSSDLDNETRLHQARKLILHEGMFDGCTEEIIMTFMRSLSYEKVPLHKKIIRQGDLVDETSRMFLIYTGEVYVEITGGNRRLIKKGAGWIFGEIALICQSIRTANVSAAVECELFSCTRSALMILPMARTVFFLRKLPLLQVMSDNSIYDLQFKALHRSYRPGEIIIKYGDIADTNVYFVRHGKVAIQKPMPTGVNVHVATASRGQVLGQRMVVTGKMRSADCVAIDNVDTLAVSAKDFAMIDTPILSGWLDYDAITTVLRTTNRIQNFDDIALDDLIEECERLTFAAGSKIIDEGEEIYGLYIIRSGIIFVEREHSDSLSDFIQEGGGFTFFGNMTKSIVSSCDVFADRETVVLKIGSKSISPSNSSILQVGNDTNQVAFQDLIFNRVIGIGNSGRVYLVVHRKNKKVYALKAMDKCKIRHAKQLQHTKNELDIFRSLDHPFCTKFIGAYQDSVWLYILQEYLPGGEFFSHLQDVAVLPEQDCKFYAANVLLALEHIHHHSMIYRDLKPENLLLDRDGYIKIADFGFAKRTKAGLRTFTICGTPAYQAPEIISRKGTGKEADVWSLGILIYEMNFNETPFESTSGDPLQTYKLAGSGRFTVPKHASPDLKDILNKILLVDPLKRPTLQDVKSHRWFKDIDWDRLFHKEITPPFKPVIHSSDDTANFDDFTGQLPPDPKPDEKLPFPDEKWSDFAQLSDFF